jgi:hypothetical protein
MANAKCKICGDEIDDPINEGNINTFLNAGAFHFTKKHVKELREFLLTAKIVDILSEDENDLYPIYFQFYPNGDMFTAYIEIHDLIFKFVDSHVERGEVQDQ